MRVLVLLGAPGAGKGTQAHVLARHLALPRVATGDLFRAAARDGTPLGLEAKTYMDRGALVPDEVTVGMLLERLAAPDAARGVILDGFPRTRAQAEALDRALVARGAAVEAALLVDVPADELLVRLSGRWLCEAAGHTFHETAYPPRVAGICDVCGSRLVQRDDDRAEVVRARLAKQLGALEDVVDHYRAAGVLQSVDGRRPIAAVTNDLLDCIEPVPYWRTHP
jgi:adenylate kinase